VKFPPEVGITCSVDDVGLMVMTVRLNSGVEAIQPLDANVTTSVGS
jgi:hypothetical protein